MFLFGGISGAFLCVPACFFWCGFPVFFVVLFLVFFGDFAGGIFCAFPGAFFTVFWCFFPCFFSCLSLFFSIYVSPWWWSCFLPCFFSWFLGVFSVFFFELFVVFLFVSFIVFFFVHFFVLFLVFFFEFFFFVPWVAPETNDHNILHFGPCFFRCFFWWSLLVKIGYTQYIYIYTTLLLIVVRKFIKHGSPKFWLTRCNMCNGLIMSCQFLVDWRISPNFTGHTADGRNPAPLEVGSLTTCTRDR